MTPRLVPTGLRRHLASFGALAILLASLSTAGAFPLEPSRDEVGTDEALAHLVISEVVTGGASASDEMVELYNPTTYALPMEGLELIYVTASGATITRKATWEAGSPEIPGGAHLLVANEAGIYATIADAIYAGGLSATGGSMALRIQDATSAIDALGWGTAASTWLEGTPAAAAPAGHSLERLPGGAGGSGQDTDDNLVDFVDRPDPDPQNSTSPPIVIGSPAPTASPSATPSAPPGSFAPTATPSAIPTLTPAPSVTPSPLPTPVATPSATPPPLTIAAARALPDGAVVTVEGVTLAGSTFADGGGFLSDSTAGIAVLVADGTYSRGQRVRVTGELDDRYHQRTLRVAASDLVVLGPGAEPTPLEVTTGSVGEAVEGRLVRIQGAVDGPPTELAGGLAFDIDDGSGATRVVVGLVTGIDTGSWESGVTITITGVVGQRDSSGSGTAGYRVMPRDALDIGAIVQPTATPGPSSSPGGSGSATATPSTDPGSPPLITIASARTAETGQPVRVRGVVTLPSGLAEPGTAAIQDGSGAIVIRLSAEAGDLRRGELVEVVGDRSTKAGMLTIYVSKPAARLGDQAEPSPSRFATARAGESQEAALIVLRGAIAGSVLTSSSGNVYFDLDDGSGPARVYISPRAGIATAALATGAWIEVVGVLLQETTGSEPDRGYRLWPRAGGDVRLVSGATNPSASVGPSSGQGSIGSGLSGGQPGTPIPFIGTPGYSGALPPALTIPRQTGSPPAIGDGASGPAATPAAPNPPYAALLLALGGLALASAGIVWSSPGIIGRAAAAVGAGRTAESGGEQTAESARSGDEDGTDAWAMPIEVESAEPAEEGSTLGERRILPPT